MNTLSLELSSNAAHLRDELGGNPQPGLIRARAYLERVVPWIEGSHVNLHWTVPNRKFNPAQPEGKGNKKFYLNGMAFTSPSAAIDQLTYLTGGRATAQDIYACMSSQQLAETKVVGGRSFLEAKRGTENVAGIKALYIDLDVKADSYATPGAAFGELRRFIAEVGLPRPTLAVSSGTGGAHIYWVLDKVLPRAEWQPLANALAEATRRHGLKVDSNCTVDSARLLRVPETWNYKGTPPLPVTMGKVIQPNDVPLDDIRRILLPYMGATVVRLPTAMAPSGKPALPQSELSAGIQAPQAPPIDIDSIKPLCGFVATALDTGGQSYAQPLWNLTTLLATFTQSARGDGRWAAHEMAKGHPGYDLGTTDALYDRKVAERDVRNIGWPSCSAVQNAGCTSCATCPLLALGKSPLAHGKPSTTSSCSAEHKSGAVSDGSAGKEDDPLTEDRAARQFAERHAGQLLFCHDTGRWHQWTGAAWQPNRCGLAFQWARELARDLCAEENPRVQYLVSKASFAGAVERFARSDPAFAVTMEGWDADPWLLGTPGGTVDLRTGDLREARREERITKLAAVTPPADAKCQTWRRFINDVTQGDTSYARFLQQLCGYCLTGDTSEQALFFAYGGGGNGKGVFIHTLAGIMADYAVNAAMETFTASKHDRHSTEIASLRGARLVTASETEQGRKWAESRIKQLTGGDVMRARYMRQDEFEFKPVMKLLLIGNNKPSLSSVDDAARRRFNLLPFLFKPALADPFLEQKLHSEWPEILRWMIEGCIDWQQNGLCRPEIVRDATNEYFEVQDTFKQWMDEKCIVQHGNPNRKATAQDLFASWGQFAIINSEPAGNMKGFGERMDRLGFKKNKNIPAKSGSGKARGYEGIELNMPTPPTARP